MKNIFIRDGARQQALNTEKGRRQNTFKNVLTGAAISFAVIAPVPISILTDVQPAMACIESGQRTIEKGDIFMYSLARCGKTDWYLSEGVYRIPENSKAEFEEGLEASILIKLQIDMGTPPPFCQQFSIEEQDVSDELVLSDGPNWIKVNEMGGGSIHILYCGEKQLKVNYNPAPGSVYSPVVAPK